MAELTRDHLVDLISRVGGSDDPLTQEIETALAGPSVAEFAAKTRSIVSDPSLALVDDDGRLTSAAAAESIIQAFGRPVFIIADNRITEDFSGPSSEVWRDRIVQARDRINAAIPAVGRIEVSNHWDLSWVGTGWLVDHDVVVTNRHVAVEFARRDNAAFAFRSGVGGALIATKIDFLEEYQRAAAAEFLIDEVIWIAPADGPDIAFLHVARTAGRPPLAGPITLASGVAPDETVATIGYPARDPRIPDQALVKKLFGEVYDKKRLAPGRILSVNDDELQHDCSTLGGNSGSLILNVASGGRSVCISPACSRKPISPSRPRGSAVCWPRRGEAAWTRRRASPTGPPRRRLFATPLSPPRAVRVSRCG